MNTNNFESALNKFNNALKVKNSSKATDGKIQALNGIGNKHFNTKNYLSALSSFEEVLNIDPVNKTAYFCRIRVLKSIANKNLKVKIITVL